jgi:hypothetical protein
MGTNKFRLGWIVGLAVVMISVAPLRADTVFNLTKDGCTGGCLNGTSGGTVSLHQDGKLVDVRVDLTLANNKGTTGFIDTGSHTTFVWNIAGNPTLSVNITSPGFVFPGDSYTDSPFGTFLDSIDCNTCGPGASTKTPPPLTFIIGRADGSALNISDFVGNAGGIYFAADVFSGLTGCTGAIGAGGPGTVLAPEPGALLLVGTGLLALAKVLHQR